MAIMLYVCIVSYLHMYSVLQGAYGCILGKMNDWILIDLVIGSACHASHFTSGTLELATPCTLMNWRIYGLLWLSILYASEFVGISVGIMIMISVWLRWHHLIFLWFIILYSFILWFLVQQFLLNFVDIFIWFSYLFHYICSLSDSSAAFSFPCGRYQAGGWDWVMRVETFYWTNPTLVFMDFI